MGHADIPSGEENRSSAIIFGTRTEKAPQMVGMMFGGASLLLGALMLSTVVDLGSALMLAGGFMFIAGWSGWHAWNRRDQRLCMTCYNLAQPERHPNKLWYCPSCGTDNPASLDCPVARAYLGRRAREEVLFRS